MSLDRWVPASVGGVGMRKDPSKHLLRKNRRLLNNHLAYWAFALRSMERSAPAILGKAGAVGREMGTERPLPRKRKRRSRSSGTRASRKTSGTGMITLRPGLTKKPPSRKRELLRGRVVFQRTTPTKEGDRFGQVDVLARRRRHKGLAAYYGKRVGRFASIFQGKVTFRRRIVSYRYPVDPPRPSTDKFGTVFAHRPKGKGGKGTPPPKGWTGRCKKCGSKNPTFHKGACPG
jgi:hypothetical protein